MTSVIDGLPLQVPITRLAPKAHPICQVVEDVIAPIRPHREHSVTFAIPLADDRNEQAGDR